MSSVSFFCLSHKKKDACVKPHSHHCWELVYYVSCAGKSNIDGTDCYFDANSFALLPPDCTHDEIHYQSGTLAYIGFQAPSLRGTAGIYRDDLYRTLYHLANRILLEGKKQLPDSEQLMELLVQELTVYLNRLQSPTGGAPNNLPYAKQFLDENYNWKINFPDLAKSCGFPFDTFRHRFKAEYGVSPKTYLIDLRLNKAKELLEGADRNCTQIAYECGFSDSAQFSTMFHRKYGISPKKFAEDLKKRED